MHAGRFAFATALLIGLTVPASGQTAKNGSAQSAAKPARADAKGRDKITRYARFQAGETVAYGIVEGENIREIEGDLFGKWQPTERTHPTSSVKFLVPSPRPTQVLAMAGNYKSHLGGDNQVTTTTTITKETRNIKTGDENTETTVTREIEKPGQVPAKFQTPQLFFKTPSCLIADGETIVIPPGTKEVHYEAELVIVVGRKGKNISENEAKDYILGVACGNDVSARDWQKGDVQWWRAKGSDTFGPVGPFIVAGLDYDDLTVTMRLNGEVKQQDRTSNLIHSVPAIVSFISRHVTLQPGDLIFTGTPGRTGAIKPGDKVEVEIEGVGKLVNSVAAASGRER